MQKEKRKEVKVSYTSKVFLHQEPKHSNSNGDAADREVTTSIRTKRSTRCVVFPLFKDVPNVWFFANKLQSHVDER